MLMHAVVLHTTKRRTATPMSLIMQKSAMVPPWAQDVALALFVAANARVAHGTVRISELADPAGVLDECTGVRDNANIR